ASVAMAALFVGRQVPDLEVGPAAQEQARVVASTATPDTATMPAPMTPEPAPAAPVQAPDAATALAAAVVVAEVPRRAAERRSSRTQQRAAARNRRAAEAPVRVAAGERALPDTMADAGTPAMLVAGTVADAPAATVTDLFTVEPAQPRPWPRAILP